MAAHALGRSAHVDTFTRDNLPAADKWPDILLAGFEYPEELNAGVELTDRMVAHGFGDHVALIGNGRRRTYKELSDWTNRIAHALVEDFGIKPGNRILIRSANNPALVACWLGATKAGAVAVNTMPMLRAGELGKIVDKAEVTLALCDTRLMDELVNCAKTSKHLKQVIGFDGTANHDAELDRIALSKDVTFNAVKTGRDDVALLGFTSGTTGEPKATMHFHRDLLVIADSYAKEILAVAPDDIFVGSPPLAFTFGLGGLAIFPLRFGATATLLENASPANMIEIIETYKATVSFTAPTAYRAMLGAMHQGADLTSLRVAVSAGETLPGPVFEEWMAKTGKPILDGIGSTEMLHIFISNYPGDVKYGTTGKAVPGYDIRLVDDEGNIIGNAGEIGELQVSGPTSALMYWNNREKTRETFLGEWTRSGDKYLRDGDDYYVYCGRRDDMLKVGGIYVSPFEVEGALCTHTEVLEAAVVAWPDEDNLIKPKAFVVLKSADKACEELARALQDHVKASLAPYKYPRWIEFRTDLPKTATGKIQRFKLRAEFAEA